MRGNLAIAWREVLRRRNRKGIYENRVNGHDRWPVYATTSSIGANRLSGPRAAAPSDS